ncbi:glucokinase [Asticcacaulis sp. YBE204]|uniref:glucokinase n=1 Tax=Asticcacaulis sp. YBE204 TaxID=1282363 RepID=UPI0003C3D2F6|nr:glucokinase [Asticcacaulis sp. YBE204]ESQ79207.1 hypothetical protein AEYBE204_09365 [Asticcacaulis sp. YBE204]
MGLVLLADVSNSAHLKLALVEQGQRHDEASYYPCRSLHQFRQSVTEFMTGHGDPAIVATALSAGGWEIDGGLTMPNHGYLLTRDYLRDLVGVQRLHIVNDCVAKAMAVRRLKNADLEKVCGGVGDPDQISVLIGTGRGLGTAGMVPDHLGETLILPCEGGHSDLPVRNELELKIYRHLERKYGHVSRERAVSLTGLVDIHNCLSDINPDDISPTTPFAIALLARQGDPTALAAVRLCQTFLADATSDAALMAGARGGVYLAGELIHIVEGLFTWTEFADRVADKGRLHGYVKDIPIYVIKARDIELIGLSTLFQ